MSATTAPRRALGRRHAGLGAQRIWWGIVILVGVQLAFDLGQTVRDLGDYARPELVITAWGVIIVADVAMMVVIRTLGDHLPNWMAGLIITALALGLVLDLAATWDPAQLGFSISAGRTATFSLLLALTTRPERELVLAAAGFTLLTGTAMALDGAFEPAAMPQSVFTLAQLCLTVVVATGAMAGFRELVRREIERALSRAALSAPRLSIGLDQSEQLARLDLAAESLLAAVAEGRVQLPLNEEISRRAGTLATELRSHLLESRSRTWLDLAIEASPLLTAAIRVDDESHSVGLLGPRQRGALLSALWLIAEQHPGRHTAATEVRIGRPVHHGPTSSAMTVPIQVRLGEARAGFDPGIWEHVAHVGTYREVHDSSRARIEISALVPVAGARRDSAR